MTNDKQWKQVMAIAIRLNRLFVEQPMDYIEQREALLNQLIRLRDSK